MDTIEIFNSLVEVKDDPEQFEKLANEIWETEIANLPDEKRDLARRQKWRMDQELSKFKDPTARLNHMISMFWKQVGEFQSVLNNPAGHSSEKTHNSADVVPLKR